MGLCKCPKRKVTNLFCFEHRVNVCESCLLTNHESCVVQTYLSWLTDSDYDANCLFCFEPLNSKETVRLKCLHLFHWDCFDVRARQLPDTTAPAGYKCPSCLECIFPAENQQSPVVDKLKAKLATVNWGRLGIGLPSMPELDQQRMASMPAGDGLLENALNGLASANANHVHVHHHPVPPNMPSGDRPVPTHSPPNYQDPFEMNTFTARTKLLADSSNGGGSLSSSVYIGNGGDGTAEDDSKYMKKASTDRSIRSRLTRLPRSLKRLLMILFLLLLLYGLFRQLLGPSGGGAGDGQGDAMFDPHANPNVRVQARGE